MTATYRNRAQALEAAFRTARDRRRKKKAPVANAVVGYLPNGRYAVAASAGTLGAGAVLCACVYSYAPLGGAEDDGK